VSWRRFGKVGVVGSDGESRGALRSCLCPDYGRVSSMCENGRAAIEALATDLERDDLALEPASGALCRQLLTNNGRSPLLDPTPGATDDLIATIHHVRNGFSSLALLPEREAE